MTYENVINVVHSLSSDRLRGLLPAGMGVSGKTRGKVKLGQLQCEHELKPEHKATAALLTGEHNITCHVSVPIDRDWEHWWCRNQVKGSLTVNRNLKKHADRGDTCINISKESVPLMLQVTSIIRKTLTMNICFSRNK